MRRAALLFVFLFSLAESAEAQQRRVLVVAGAEDDVVVALRVELAAQSIAVETAADETGCASALACVRVFSDRVEVFGATLRSAPLPPDSSARTVALITSSLLSELASPPEDELEIRLEVHIEAGAPAGDRSPLVMEPAPAPSLPPVPEAPAADLTTSGLGIHDRGEPAIVDPTEDERMGVLLSAGASVGSLVQGLSARAAADFDVAQVGLALRYGYDAERSTGPEVATLGLFLSFELPINFARFLLGADVGFVAASWRDEPLCSGLCPAISFYDLGNRLGGYAMGQLSVTTDHLGPLALGLTGELGVAMSFNGDLRGIAQGTLFLEAVL